MSPTSGPRSDVSLIPALPPPPGVTPNFIDPVSRAPAVIAANGVITAVLLLFVIARLAAKFAYARSQLGWEDIFCVTGTFLSLALMVIITWLFRSGLGPHMWDIRFDAAWHKAAMLSKGVKAVTAMYSFTMIFTKLSILLLFFRLFGLRRSARIWIYSGIFLNLITHIVGSVLSLTNGAPVNPKENVRYPSRTNVVVISVSIANILGDIYILLLPLSEVSRLQLNRGQKLRVLAVFSTGVLACIVGIIGVILRFLCWPYPDVSWNSGPQMVTLLYEIDIGLIVGCMPILPLFAKHSDGLTRLLSGLLSLLSCVLGHRDPYSGKSRNESHSRNGHLGHPTRIEGLPARPRHYLQLQDYSDSTGRPSSISGGSHDGQERN